MLIRTDEHILIFDAGSGIVQLGKDLLPEIFEHKKNSDHPFHITMLFTHTHIDHLLGFPYFAPLYIPGVHITMIGPATMGVEFEDILRNLVEPQYYPVAMDEFRCTKEFYNISENTVVYFTEGESAAHIGTVGRVSTDLAEMVVKAQKYYFHPKDGSYNYRINRNGHSIVFATDVEQYVGSDQRLVQFSKDADVLIHDSQYNLEQYPKFQGYGHSSFQMACEAAKQANAKKLILFHHDPNNDDATLEQMEKDARNLFSDTQLASETWELKL